MHVSELESLSTRLHRLQQQLRSASMPGDQALDEEDALVQAAKECEFMLPPALTVRTLAETVDKKINNVTVLLERARRHESLPEDAQLAAEQEYMASDEDFLAGKNPQDGMEAHKPRR